MSSEDWPRTEDIEIVNPQQADPPLSPEDAEKLRVAIAKWMKEHPPKMLLCRLVSPDELAALRGGPTMNRWCELVQIVSRWALEHLEQIRGYSIEVRPGVDGKECVKVNLTFDRGNHVAWYWTEMEWAALQNKSQSIFRSLDNMVQDAKLQALK